MADSFSDKSGGAGDQPTGGHRLLSVVVPVYNERNNIGEVVRRMRAATLPIDLEIVIVDDGSTDGTDKVLAAVEDSTVRVVRHESNRGKGAAVRTGIAAARGDLVLIQDADLRYDPSDWPALLHPILSGRAVAVCGSRYRGERATVPLVPYLTDRFLSIAASMLFNTTVSDVKTCFKLFDRTLIDSITLESDGFNIDLEIIAKLLRTGTKIHEVPVSYFGRGDDEIRRITRREQLEGLGTLLRYRFSHG